MSALRAVVAARISQLTDESVSIQRQVKSGEAYALARQWPVVGYVRDEDVSATKIAPFDRPDLKKWLDRPTDWDVLIFWKLDRIIRSPMDLTDMIRWCEAHGKSLVFVEDNFDLSTPMGQAMAYIAAVFAKMEAQRISERKLAANKELRTTGRWFVGRAPYGFRSVEAPDGKGKTLEQDPAQVRILHWMRAEMVGGRSLNAIVNELTDNPNTPAPHGGHVWRRSAAHKLLTSPACQGVRMHKGKPVLGPDGMPQVIAEPIFTDREWTELQSLLEKRAGKPQRTAKVASPYLGVLFCKCGKSLFRRREMKTNRPSGLLVDKYVCRNRQHKGVGQPRTAEVNQLVETLLLSQYGDQPRMRRVFVPGEDHTAELGRVEKSIERLRDDREAGDYDNDEHGYRSRMDRLRAARDQLASLPHRPDSYELEDTGELWAEWWHGADEDERRTELVRAGVRIYYHRAASEKDSELGFLADPAIRERLADPSARVAERVPMPDLIECDQYEEPTTA